jgi:hypothetical protein
MLLRDQVHASTACTGYCAETNMYNPNFVLELFSFSGAFPVGIWVSSLVAGALAVDVLFCCVALSVKRAIMEYLWDVD